jgi:hypothetical protein
MTTKEVAPAEWSEFFDRLNRVQRGWHATLEIQGAEIGAQLEAKGLPLDGFAADVKDRPRSLSVVVRTGPLSSLTHTIGNPARITMEADDAGLVQALLIEPGDGPRTLVRLSRP